jgi:hypothetical protein
LPHQAPEKVFYITLRGCNHFSFFILTERGVGIIVGNVVAFLWRGAWGGFVGLAWHPPIALTGWAYWNVKFPHLHPRVKDVRGSSWPRETKPIHGLTFLSCYKRWAAKIVLCTSFAFWFAAACEAMYPYMCHRRQSYPLRRGSYCFTLWNVRRQGMCSYGNRD